MKLRGVSCMAGKDVMEWLADRDSRRGFAIQAVIFILLIGIFVPWTTPSIWRSPGEVVLLYVVFPSLIASMLSADAFAGEKERHTLESLLATPLTDTELFLDKVAAAVGLSVAVCILAVIAGVLVLLLKALYSPVLLPSVFQCISVIVASFTAALTIAVLAVLVSSRVSVARSAQQIVQVVFLMFTGLISFGLNRFSGELTWHKVAWSCTVLIVVGLIGLVSASRLFSRERLAARL